VGAANGISGRGRTGYRRNWLAGIGTLQEANQFLCKSFIAEFNRLFVKPVREKGTAFRKCSRRDLDRVFSMKTERTVDNDNTVAIRERCWQLDKTPFRRTLAECRVTICEHLDGTVSVCWGPHAVGRFDAEGRPLKRPARETQKWSIESEGNSLRQQGSESPLYRFPSGECRGGRVPLAPGARYAPARSAGTHRGCRPLVNPPLGCA
jgi:hypothetical protein